MTGTVIVGLYVCLGLMPESPRWLVNNGREEQAMRSLAKMHANGDENDELVMNEVAQIKDGLALDNESKLTGYR